MRFFSKLCTFAPLRDKLSQTTLIITLFLVVFILELITPPAYVFGYLYTGSILLVNTYLGRKATIYATMIAVFFTLINLWIPLGQINSLPTIANRLIATVSLIVTEWLCEQNRLHQERLIQQETLLRSQENLVRLRQDFASTLTHDLKTPLWGAIETIKAFQDGKFGQVTDRQKQVLGTMIRSHQSSLQLVETVLDVYHNDLEGLKLNLAPLDLTVLTENVTNTLAELASVNQVYLSVNFGESDFRQSLWVNGDRFQLQRVLTNLLINAINHSRRGDRIEIILCSQSNSQIVKILDHGPGIKPEEFTYLFQRFYQGNSDRQAKGTGLGLYLSRQIIEAHDGKIIAENRYPSGAIFGFSLPVYLTELISPSAQNY